MHVSDAGSGSLELSAARGRSLTRSLSAFIRGKCSVTGNTAVVCATSNYTNGECLPRLQIHARMLRKIHGRAFYYCFICMPF